MNRVSRLTKVPGPFGNSIGLYRKGATAVEFAIVAPIIFMFFFAIVEFGRFQVLRMTANEVAYESCRAGIAVGASISDVEELSQRLLSTNGIANSVVTITPSVIDDSTQEVSVRVLVPLDNNLWIGASFLRNDISAQTTLDHENSIFFERAGQ